MADLLTLGAIPQENNRCQFRIWAPTAEAVEVHLVAPGDRLLPLTDSGNHYFSGTFEDVPPGSLYFYRFNGHEDIPDPASRFQPRGIDGPSQVVDPAFPWEDAHWTGIPLEEYLVYELHVGVFTPHGTFEAIIPRLDELVELGVTALEIMPVAQFSGVRNWGYDGVFPFAVQNSYGGPEGLKKLVNACHQRGLAVILDVIYNHLGPEGNCLRHFGAYCSEQHKTPWGEAMNFDGPYSDEVRRFFIENALYWITEFHFDALRLDAADRIIDQSAYPFLAQLADKVHRQGQRLRRLIYLMAESDLNDPRFIRSRELGGYEIDVHWTDDFHHALHCLLTGEKSGYYVDYGLVEHLARAFRQGFIYTGEYSPYRERSRGAPCRDVEAVRFLVFSQNHDQVGNRLRCDRFSTIISFDGLKVAAGAVLLSPFLPLLFMGEEYGEPAPFLYFVDHRDPFLIEAVRQGRKMEFCRFDWDCEPMDPQGIRTFEVSKLNRELRREGKHKALWEFYRELIRLRKEILPLARLSKERQEVTVFEKRQILLIHRWHETEEIIALLHFGQEAPQTINIFCHPGIWRKRLDSSEEGWYGSGSAIPPTIPSDGEISLTLAPLSVVLLSGPEGA